MSKNKRNSSGGFIFSTNPDFKPFEDEEPADVLPNDRQVLRIWLERIKGGREATVIKGFIGPDEDLEALAKVLKNKCATGGNAKDGIIIIQGDHREKVLQYLLDAGHKNTKKAGG
jgi:translation initiation factor 1